MSLTLGEKIQDKRIESGLKTKELADKAKIHRMYLSRIESGKQKPSLKVLAKIANSLNVGIKDLIG